MESETNAPCPFCSMDSSRIVAENKTVYAIEDSSPVSCLHMLIIPRRHSSSYFELSPEELADADKMIRQLQQTILKADPRVNGFNIGVNCGFSAGQTIFHTHIHLIPRRSNDTPCPRGGVRGVIPGKMNY